MCMVSNIGDNWRDTFPKQYPDFPNWLRGDISRTEFDALKKEVQELKELLTAAKKYDEATGQKDCEAGDKVKLIKEIAKLVGVNMDEVFNTPNNN